MAGWTMCNLTLSPSYKRYMSPYFSSWDNSVYPDLDGKDPIRSTIPDVRNCDLVKKIIVYTTTGYSFVPYLYIGTDVMITILSPI